MSSANVSEQYRAFDEGLEDYENALHPSQDVVEYFKEYARQKPEVAALWCFGIGFILGWKLKPW